MREKECVKIKQKIKESEKNISLYIVELKREVNCEVNLYRKYLPSLYTSLRAYVCIIQNEGGGREGIERVYID